MTIVMMAALAAVALFYVGREIYWLFRPWKSPGARGLMNGWDEGARWAYEELTGRPEAGHWLLPEENPYREARQ